MSIINQFKGKETEDCKLKILLRTPFPVSQSFLLTGPPSSGQCVRHGWKDLLAFGKFVFTNPNLDRKGTWQNGFVGLTKQ
jgi:hypothetical protein